MPYLREKINFGDAVKTFAAKKARNEFLNK